MALNNNNNNKKLVRAMDIIKVTWGIDNVAIEKQQVIISRNSLLGYQRSHGTDW